MILRINTRAHTYKQQPSLNASVWAVPHQGNASQGCPINSVELYGFQKDPVPEFRGSRENLHEIKQINVYCNIYGEYMAGVWTLAGRLASSGGLAHQISPLSLE